MVVVSHLHGDHFGGLPFLVLDGQFSGRDAAAVLDDVEAVKVTLTYAETLGGQLVEGTVLVGVPPKMLCR